MPYPMQYLRRTKNQVEMDNDFKTGSKKPSDSQASPSKSNSSSLNGDSAPRKKLQKKNKIPRYLNESYEEAEDEQTPLLPLAKRAEIRCLLSCSKRDYEKPGEDYYAWVPRVRTVSTKNEVKQEQDHGVRQATGSYTIRTGRTFEATSPRRWTIRRVYDTEEDDEGEKKLADDEEEEHDDELKEEDEQEGDDSDDHGKDDADEDQIDTQQQPFWHVSESLSARETGPRPRRNSFDASAEEGRILLSTHEGGDVQDFDTTEDNQEDSSASPTNTDLLPRIDSKRKCQPKKKFPRLAANVGCTIRSSHPRPLTPVQEVEEPESEEDDVSDYGTAEDGESAEICTVERLEVRVVRMSMEAKDEMRKLRGQSGGVRIVQEERDAEAEGGEEDEWRSESIWERIGRRRAMEGRS
ncbi:hypothetical protein CBER1_04567 [Cercospora berteroae]|uniref:Uncharacterized protein n=1 Tax=Cercospora berteroae TaxID=357750 RepID=A0A2S6C245_9PEZI|nr:hypothetical protein CBER1_04567 [Cercospora berteroae]